MQTASVPSSTREKSAQRRSASAAVVRAVAVTFGPFTGATTGSTRRMLEAHRQPRNA